MAEPNIPGDSLHYHHKIGGLNNQKLALFGLFVAAARHGPRRIILPDFCMLDEAYKNELTVELGSVFDMQTICAFAARNNIEILRERPKGSITGREFFDTGIREIIHNAGARKLGRNNFALDFFRSLVPHVQHSDLLRRVHQEVFQVRGVEIVTQLRIELDWIRYSAASQSKRGTKFDDYTVSFQDIVAKIKNTLSNWKSGIYVVCDEAAMPCGKEEIRTIVKRDLGIDLMWKSDFMSATEMSRLSLLELSILDFEMAVEAPSFVGLSRSTFSNMACIEKYARTGTPVTSHYIYNLPGPNLGLRTDGGTSFVAQQAVKPPVQAVLRDMWVKRWRRQVGKQ